MAKSLKDVLAKTSRVLLDLDGRPRLEGLVLSVEDDKLRLYRHKKAHHAANFLVLRLAEINSVWDRSSGARLWARSDNR